MTKPDDELVRLLTDPDNPRTPLHFKRLDHQHAPTTGFQRSAADSAFHRTEGYACGVGSGSPKPISKLFGEPNGE